jgi:hypothetical protein
VTFFAPSLALMLLALAGFVALDLWRRRTSRERPAAACLAALCAVAFVAHLGALRRGEGGGAAVVLPAPHYHELFHYYVGTKYFAELGYEGLYDAAVLADHEDDPEHFAPQRAMRDLATNRIVPRSRAVARAAEIRAPFTPERWDAFRGDVDVFRQASLERWRARGPVIDHGYNGTPLVTAILGGLAAQPWLGTRDYLGLVSLLDPYLLALFAAALAGLEGAFVALSFLFFAFANPLNEYGFTGGGYLRTDYLLALAAGFVALRRGARASAGAFLAVAAALRLFPVAVYGCLLLRDLAGPGWRARLRANARLHAGFAAAALAILTVGSLVPTPDGRNAWLACADNIRKHTSAPSANLVSLSAIVAYAPEKDRLTFGRSPASLESEATGEAPFDWIAETRRVLAERRWYHAAAALVLVTAALLALRRVGAAEVLFPALLIVFAILPVSHYYWALLALVPLSVSGRSRIPAGLAVTCAAFALAVWPGLLDAHIDLRFALLSLALGAFLLAATAALALRRTRRVPLAGAAACVALLGCSEAPLPAETLDAELPIEGDRYESETFGFAIEKPADWVFLRGSSLLRDGDGRAEDRWEMWENLRKPALTPLVAIAPRADADPTRDPILRVHVIPIDRAEGERGIAMLTSIPSTGVVETFSYSRQRDPHTDFSIVTPAAPLQVAGLDGAGILIRYAMPASDGEPPGPDGKPVPKGVEERLWHVRRGEQFWYFSQLGPEPLSPESLARFEEILRSVQFED